MTDSQDRDDHLRALSINSLDQGPRDDDGRQLINGVQRNPTPKTLVQFYVDRDKVGGKTPKTDNQGVDKDGWAIPLSIFYGLILVLIGLVATVGDVVAKRPLPTDFIAIYLSFLYIGSTIILILIMVFKSRRHRQSKPATTSGNSTNPNDSLFVRMRNYTFDTGSTSTEGMESSGARNRTNTATTTSEIEDINSMDGYYDGDNDSYEDDESFEERLVFLQRTASQGQTGAGFFLRIGCLVFGIANILYVSLEIYDDSRLTRNPSCKVNVYQLYLQLVFLLVQTVFLFQFSSSCAPRYKIVSRFGLQHLIATNLVVWIRVFTEEVVLDLIFPTDDSSSSSIDATDSCNMSYREQTIAQINPYLIPFVLEYSLIAIAVVAGIYLTLCVQVQVDIFASLKRAMKKGNKKRDEEDFSEEWFSNARTGLFTGALVMALTIITVVLFFVYGGKGQSTDDVRVILQHSYGILVQFLQIVAVIISTVFLRRLEFTYGRYNQIDQLLLIISVTGLILSQFVIMFGCINTINSGHLTTRDQGILGVEMTGTLITIILGILQTCLILEGLQRHTSSKEHQRNKPGREAITFLVVTNLAMWFFSTFTDDVFMNEVTQFYKGVWPIVSGLCIPLAIFYRFHSSVCLANVWSIAYMAEEGGLKYKEF